MKFEEYLDQIADCYDHQIFPEVFIEELMSKPVEHKLELLRWILFVFESQVPADFKVIINNKIKILQNGLRRCRRIKSIK